MRIIFKAVLITIGLTCFYLSVIAESRHTYKGFTYIYAQCGKMEYDEDHERDMMRYDYYFTGIFEYEYVGSEWDNVSQGYREKYEDFLKKKYRVTECTYINISYLSKDREDVKKIQEAEIKKCRQYKSVKEGDVSIIVDSDWEP